ncbi:MAG: hypothetical protein AAGE98_14325 [Actinomycetota bacterium]
MRQIEASGGVEFRPTGTYRWWMRAQLVGAAGVIAVLAGVITGIALAGRWVILLCVPLLLDVALSLRRSWSQARGWAFVTERDVVFVIGKRTERWFPWEDVAGMRIASGGQSDESVGQAWIELLTTDGEIVAVPGSIGRAEHTAYFDFPVGKAFARMRRTWEAWVGPVDEPVWPTRPASGRSVRSYVTAGLAVLGFLLATEAQ